MIGAQSPVATEVFTICQLGLLTCYLKPLTRFASSTQGRSHTFAEIGYKLISTAILLPSTDSRKVVVIYKQKYVHEVLVNHLVKLTQEKSVVR